MLFEGRVVQLNEINTLLAAKLINQLQGQTLSSTSDVEELVGELTADKNSLHLCFSKIYFDEDKPVEEMTIEEYRSYTENKINCFTMHPQQKKVNYTIHITETGLLIMKSDKEYEKHVFSSIQTAFNQPYYSPFSENCLLYFDNKENSCSMSWSSIKNIQEEPAIKTTGTLDTSDVLSNVDEDSFRKTENEYIFKRISPVSILVPSSRYAKALYAYNIAPDDWMQNKKHWK